MSDQSNAFKPQNKGSKVLFKNPIIERLSRTNTGVPVSIFLGFSTFLMMWGYTYSSVPALNQTAVFFLGLLIFTFTEYMVHRHVFHMLTNTKFREKLQYHFHGVHHEFPKDTGRLAMPPIISAAIVGILFLIFKFTIGDHTYGFLPGFITGYSLYLIVHYIVHAYQPPKNFLKVLWIHHGIHHYKDHERAFGVSSPLWDHILGTMPKKQKVTAK